MDEERLAKARSEEMAAAQAYQQAHADSGAAKQAIAEERKQREEEMKRAEAARPKPVAAAAAPQQIAGTGSVWNTNSYHWEEKSVAAWSNDTLRSILSGFSHSMNDAKVSVTEIAKLEGESSVSIRKGKKIITYEYNIQLKWKCVLSNSGEDGPEMKVEGKWEMPDMCNDDEWEEWEVRTEWGEDPDNLR